MSSDLRRTSKPIGLLRGRRLHTFAADGDYVDERGFIVAANTAGDVRVDPFEPDDEPFTEPGMAAGQTIVFADSGLPIVCRAVFATGSTATSVLIGKP